MSVSLEELPTDAAVAWVRLRDELKAILGDDLVALFAHGGTTFPDRPHRPGDLDTYAFVEREPGERTRDRIEEAEALISRESGVAWDNWYTLAAAAREPLSPHHALRPERRDTCWAIHRAHWHAGRYALLHGPRPEELVPAPTWPELEVDLRRELEHLERHVVEGDDDPFEATYAIWTGSRIVHALETGNVVISKRSAGAWALGHLPPRWREAIEAAGRSYDAETTAADAEVLREAMAPFVAMVRERLPVAEQPAPGELPRWSGH